jgi:hypothetical protein
LANIRLRKNSANASLFAVPSQDARGNVYQILVASYTVAFVEPEALANQFLNNSASCVAWYGQSDTTTLTGAPDDRGRDSNQLTSPI